MAALYSGMLSVRRASWGVRRLTLDRQKVPCCIDKHDKKSECPLGRQLLAASRSFASRISLKQPRSLSLCNQLLRNTLPRSGRKSSCVQDITLSIQGGPIAPESAIELNHNGPWPSRLTLSFSWNRLNVRYPDCGISAWKEYVYTVGSIITERASTCSPIV